MVHLPKADGYGVFCVKQDAEIRTQPKTTKPALSQVVTTPECLSASVLTICHGVNPAEVNELIEELSRQSAAVCDGDLARVESMLLAQAHTLDGLFAKLASRALTSNSLDMLEQYMKLALRSQNQARATLQILAEIKVPKQLAFVQQANIASQMQVNNSAHNEPMCAGKKQKSQNELLEEKNGERLDTRKESATSGADSAVAAVAE